jgi:RNA-directed DNA polymerase
LSNLNKLQRKQTTQYRGQLVEVEVELQGKLVALSKNLALTKGERENNVFEDANNLLDRVLMKENMKLALKRVIANKGSHGVDKMRS